VSGKKCISITVLLKKTIFLHVQLLLTKSEYGDVSHAGIILVISTKQDHFLTVGVDSECGSSMTRPLH